MATALIEGIVQLVVTHVDGLWFVLRSWLPGLLGELVVQAVPVLFTIAIVAAVVALISSNPVPKDREEAPVQSSEPGPIEQHLIAMRGRVRQPSQERREDE